MISQFLAENNFIDIDFAIIQYIQLLLRWSCLFGEKAIEKFHLYKFKIFFITFLMNLGFGREIKQCRNLEDFNEDDLKNELD